MGILGWGFRALLHDHRVFSNIIPARTLGSNLEFQPWWQHVFDALTTNPPA